MLAFTLASPTWAKAAELRVLASVAMKSALDTLIPGYEKASGNTIVVAYGAGAGQIKQITGGAVFDVTIVPASAIDGLVQQGVLQPAPRAVVGVTVASLAYRDGTPKPEITTPEALKAVLISARSISLSDPALGGASSNYFMKVVEKLGVGAAIKDKLILTKPGEGAAPVGSGAAEFAAALSSEIAAVPGVSGVAIFPADISGTTTLAIALSSKAAQPEAGRGFVDFLQTPAAVAVRRAKGLMAD